MGMFWISVLTKFLMFDISNHLGFVLLGDVLNCVSFGWRPSQ